MYLASGSGDGARDKPASIKVTGAEPQPVSGRSEDSNRRGGISTNHS